MTPTPRPSQKPRPAATTFDLNEGSYLEMTRRPIYALAFLLPLLVIYEAGTLLVNTEVLADTVMQQRVVAYVWLEALARAIGVRPQYLWLCPGLIVVILLLSWHIASKKPWTVHLALLFWMLIECIVLSFPLFAFSALLNPAPAAPAAQASLAAIAPLTTAPANLVTSIGAGIYEELVFRLILMGLLLLFLEDLLGVPRNAATLIAVIISALLFSAHHHVAGVEQGRLLWLEHFDGLRFFFRTMAGVYFAVLFRYRGYGITAGTHAAYNIILYLLRSAA